MISLRNLLGIASIAAALAVSSPLLAQQKKAAAAPGKTRQGVEFRLVHKNGADTIEGYNSNTGYDAVVKFEYQKLAMGAKAPETVSGREKLPPEKPVTIVNGGTKFKVQGVEIKEVELRTKL